MGRLVYEKAEKSRYKKVIAPPPPRSGSPNEAASFSNKIRNQVICKSKILNDRNVIVAKFGLLQQMPSIIYPFHVHCLPPISALECHFSDAL